MNLVERIRYLETDLSILIQGFANLEKAVNDVADKSIKKEISQEDYYLQVSFLYLNFAKKFKSIYSDYKEEG